ncbi:MAG: hypothetical protein Q7J32_12550 [Sphingomonadaceae bacterium]|nr:hypothetical protein [Sphingomonadaceae bacterium]
MDLGLDARGDPVSAFILACGGRRIDLSGGEDAPHPLQLIPTQWRTIRSTLGAFVQELVAVEASIQPGGDAVLHSFRQLVYDATELFDSYATLLPARLGRPSRESKPLIAGYRTTAKRLRDDCAQLCNRFKHNGAQLKFLWARSPTNGLTGARLLVSSYNGRGGLLRDDTVHKGQMAGIGLVRWGQDLSHKLLRIDRAAALLIGKLPDADCDQMPFIPPALPVGAEMRQLAALRATRHADESTFHDGLAFTDCRVSLVRATADDFGPSATVITTITMEAGTTKYSIA